MTEATRDLTPEELRVLGSLAEKQLTTPDQYPLTLNSLTLACNQRSSRDPVVGYDERTVEAAVTAAKTKGFARFVHPSHGRSAVRYAHTMEEALGLSQRQLALVTVLLLRGPQTPGELRARTDRMADFEDLGDLERDLERLRNLEEPLVERLTRRPGQSQDRYRHLLGSVSTTERDTPAETETPDGPATADGYEKPLVPTPPAAGDFQRLREEVSGLHTEIEELRRELAELRNSLGG